MALNAKALLDMLPDLERFLAMKASEEFEAGMGEAEEGAALESATSSHEGPPSPPDGGEKPGGMGVVIALKPKGGKVEGCPDCADGTPHEHAGK